ncbi:DUF3558 domain-containing protein [Actinokineospora globicatena]|uniref:DUF3558 domain-containing protein n=1 Tax=Actinokineospora globicatena TaxID=103729 RepID=A0A9W6V986_9PSEU|nr:DUF3558 domain-containing protein [Actinokineospora globicatena]GLW93077.1 hypothetical protein Aglo03_38930 [Actinokineospora globicatena]
MSRTLLACVIALAALTSACSESGSPVPSTSPGTSAAPATQKYGAPTVEKPIDAGSFLEDPCAVLTAQQAGELGLDKEGTPRTVNSDNLYCGWKNREELSYFDFGWLNSNKGGLDDTYRVFQSGKGYFEPVEIDGYPGVFHFGTDNRDKGHCNLVVGIRDELTFLVGVTGGGAKPCDKVRELADLAITTMKEG